METQLDELVPLSIYGEKRRHIFPSPHSVDWFLRKHRLALIEAGALLLLMGRWFVNSPRFDAYMLAEGSASATKRS